MSAEPWKLFTPGSVLRCPRCDQGFGKVGHRTRTRLRVCLNEADTTAGSNIIRCRRCKTPLEERPEPLPDAA